MVKGFFGNLRKFGGVKKFWRCRKKDPEKEKKETHWPKPNYSSRKL